MLSGVEPFASWHTPVAWTGYILLVDALIWQRRGHSWIRNAPAELLFMAAASIPLWVVFEIYNAFFIHNWHYIGLPSSVLVRYAGYAWAFATITPGILLTAELISALRDRRAPEHRGLPSGRQRLTAARWLCVLLGAAMLLLPIVYPSPYLAAPVFLGFILLLDPLNAAAGSESIIADWHDGHAARLVNLLLAGLVCGLLWEFWNYWAWTKWIYTVPILPEVKIFEMPILGFGGFPPFAVECFTMYVAVRRWTWGGAPRPLAL